MTGIEPASNGPAIRRSAIELHQERECFRALETKVSISLMFRVKTQMTGFEPATLSGEDRRSDQVEPHLDCVIRDSLFGY